MWRSSEMWALVIIGIAAVIIFNRTAGGPSKCDGCTLRYADKQNIMRTYRTYHHARECSDDLDYIKAGLETTAAYCE